MFAGSTPISTPRYSSVVKGRSPSTHCWADTPCGWSTQAAVQRAATDSAGSGTADSGRLLGTSGVTGGSTVGVAGAAPPPAPGDGVSVAPPAATAVPTLRA